MFVSIKFYIVALSFILPCGKPILRQIAVSASTKKEAREYCNFFIDQFTERNSDEDETRLSTNKVIVLQEVPEDFPQFRLLQHAMVVDEHYRKEGR